jgi:hypothetical protein
VRKYRLKTRKEACWWLLISVLDQEARIYERCMYLRTGCWSLLEGGRTMNKASKRCCFCSVHGGIT